MLIGWQVYEGGEELRSGSQLAEAIDARSDGEHLWIRLTNPDAAALERLRDAFALPELAVEDAGQAHQRPKLERYGATSFMVVKPATYDDAGETIVLGEVDVFLGDRFAITISHGPGDPLGPVCARLADQPDLSRLGPSSVLYAVLDHVVDGYAPVVQGLERDVDEIEAEVFAVDQQPPTERIYSLMREVLDFERATGNLLMPLDDLATGRVAGVDEGLAPFFRDVADHARVVHERTEQFRALLAGALDANVALIGLRENRDQRKMSAWAAIALVPTIIGGVWGMNVPQLPLDDSDLGFPVLLVLMVGVSAYLYWRFRRHDWL